MDLKLMFRRIFVLVALLGLVGFGFSQFTTCTNITNSGSYTIGAPITGNSTFGGVGSCIYINISNVTLDCTSKTLTGNESGSTGIYLFQTYNVTLQNCIVANHSFGVRLNSANDSLITNTTAHTTQNAGSGFTLPANSRNNIISNCVAYNNTLYGFSIGSANTTYLNDTAYNNSDTGFRLEGAENNTFIGSSAFNNTYGFNMDGLSNNNSFLHGLAYENFVSGFFTDNAHYNTFDNNSAYNNTLSGFDFENSNFTSLSNSSAYNNSQYGVYLLSAISTTILNNSAYNNTLNGFHLAQSNSSTINYNTAFDNPKNGFAITASSYYNRLGFSSATTNGAGFHLSAADSNWLFNNTASSNGYGFNMSQGAAYNNVSDNTAFSNTVDGFNLFQANYNNLTNNSAYSNAQEGYILSQSVSNILADNYARDNGVDGFSSNTNSNLNTFFSNDAYRNGLYGIYITDADQNTLTDNIASTSTSSAFFLNALENSTITNNIAFNNTQHGFIITASKNNTFTTNTAYNNTMRGFYIVLSAINNTFMNTVAYGNLGFAFWLANTCEMNNFTNTLIYSQDHYVFQDATAANSNNFANLTLGYNSTIGLINYQLLNITDLYLNITNLLLDPYFVSLNDSAATQANKSANVTIYTDNCAFPVLKAYGFPASAAEILLNGFAYTTADTCPGASPPFTAIFDVAGFSGYTMNDTVGCVNLSDIATWGIKVRNNSVTGVLNVNANTTLCTDTYGISNQVVLGNQVIEMNSSNIFLDCNNSLIRGSSGSGDGIYSSNKGNNTIRNCLLSIYSDGIYLEYSNGSIISNNTGYENVQSAIYLLASSGGMIANNTAYNNTYGIYADMVDYSNFIGNDLSESIEGLQLGGTYNSNYNNITNNIAYNSSFGFYLYNSSNNTFINNTARNNTDGGFIIEIYFDDNTFINNTAYGNTQGFYLVNSSINDLITNTAYDNVYGFYLATSSNSNTFTGNAAYNNTDTGFYISSSSGNAFTNNSAYNNIWYGFYLASSANSILTNNTAHDSTYGFTLSSSNYNTLQRNVAYNNTNSGFYLLNANGSLISNSTSYSNANAGFYASNSRDNNFTDSVAYSNAGLAIYSASVSINRLTNTLLYNQTYLALVSANSPSNFTNLTLGYNATVGIIRYQSLNVTTGLTLVDGTNIYLRPDWVSLDGADADAADANVPAYITINNSNCATLGVLRATGFPTSMAEILTNGVHYPTTKACNGNLATFNVSGFSGYTLGQETTNITFNATPSTPITFGTETNVSCNASNSVVALAIYRNGTAVAGPGTGYLGFLANLSAGSYNFTCNTTGNGNYTNASRTILYTVNKNTTVLTLAMPLHPTAGEEVNVSCDASNSEANISLYRDGVNVANGTTHIEEVVALPAGSYTYVCNTSGSGNYTNATVTGVLDGFQVSSQGGGAGTDCYLEGVVAATAVVGTDVPIQIFRYSDSDSTRTSLFGANVNIIHGGTVVSYTTDTQGFVHYTPTSAGTYTYAASFGDCYDTDGTFRATDAQGITVGFEQGCTSIISLYTEVCEEQPSESTMGALACRQVPVAGETVQVYGCEGEVCTELLGTFTTDSDGEVGIDYTDGNVRIVVPANEAHGELERYQQLLSSGVCGQPTITTISFDPGCPSTISVLEEGCEETLRQTLTGLETVQECSERPAEGVQVEVYRCTEEYIAELVQCDELIGTYTTDSDGQATTGEVDGYIRIVATGEDGIPYEASGTLPSSQECLECTSDSDCGQDELCRGGQCVPREQVPPEERPCSTASDCPAGYNCGTSSLCTQLPPVEECTLDDQCAAGYLCRESACVDERTVIGGGGVEGGGIAGFLGNIVNAVQKSFVFIVLLLALLLLLWFFFWKKRKGRRAPRTQEELIAQEEERGRPRRK